MIEYPSRNLNQDEDLTLQVEKIFSNLDKAKSDQDKKIWTSAIMDALEKYLVSSDVLLSKEMQDIYNQMERASSSLLVRRESLEKIFDALIDKKKIILSAENIHGGNTALANAEGVRIAMSEGRSRSPITALIAFDKKNLKVEECPIDVRENRKFCRLSSGEIKFEDIKFLILRIPKKYMNEEDLSPEENNDESLFAFRGVKF